MDQKTKEKSKRKHPDKFQDIHFWFYTKKINYFFLCLFFLKRFLRLWVAILCLFLFLPLGIILSFNVFTNSVIFLTQQPFYQ